MRQSLLFLALALSFHLSAQKDVFLKIAPKVNGTDLVLGSDYTDQQGVVFNLDYFNYYLSGLFLTHDGGQELDLSDTVFLVKPESGILYLGYLNVNSIESMRFSIGVPPNLNTASGPDAVDISVYPSNHPLSFQDPSMYWGWSAGYIFLVTGGNADSNADGIADAYFELHDLGEHNYVETSLPIIQTNVGDSQVDIYVDCNIEQWLKNVPLETISILHGTSGYNASSMANVISEPVFTQPSTADIPKLTSNEYQLFYHDETVCWKGCPNNSSVVVSDLTGKIVFTFDNATDNGSASLGALVSGAYVVSILNEKGLRIKSLKIIR